MTISYFQKKFSYFKKTNVFSANINIANDKGFMFFLLVTEKHH